MRWPRSLYGRMVLLMGAGLVVAQVLGTALQLWDRHRSLSHSISHELAERVIALYRTVDAAPPEQRAQLLVTLSTPLQRLSLSASAPPDRPQTSMLDDLPGHLRQLLHQAVPIHAIQLPRLGDFRYELYLQLGPDRWLRVDGRAPDGLFALPWNLLLNLGLMLLVTLGLVALAARATVRPLTDLARAAHGLSADLRQPPLPEQGPSEVRAATHAFNAMQQRIRSGIEEREHFLAAVSHDLRTPLTRMRLRAELIDDPRLADALRADIGDMLYLLDGTLDFLRGKAVEEPLQPIDLAAMLESIVEDFQGLGTVTLQAPDTLRWQGRPQALRRALVNLIDNALKYGQRADVTLQQIGEHEVQVRVDDAGPGIPEAELDKVFDPFYRVDNSRSRDTGGTGLGLAIVRQIAHSHGGRVSLSNRAGGGLRAVLLLPAQASRH